MVIALVASKGGALHDLVAGHRTFDLLVDSSPSKLPRPDLEQVRGGHEHYRDTNHLHP